MEEIELQPRLKSDGSTNSLLKNNKIPCVVYGKNIKTQSLSVELKEVESLIKSSGFYSKILTIELNGKTEKVLPKEVQFHPVSDNVIHIDFMSVQDTTTVTVEVPIQFLNKEKCPAIKQGGVLNIVRRNVELVCNANKIPDLLEFDLISSEIGDSIKISNIQLSEDVKPSITDRDFVIATLVPPTVEAEPEKEKEEETEEGKEQDEKSEDKKEGSTAEKKDESAENKKPAENKKEESK